MNVSEHAEIKRFVRNTLGCGCPEEVFQAIDCRYNVRLATGIVLDAMLVIADRLLIYVVEADAEGLSQSEFTALVAAGKEDRDARQLNRFRLVVAADEALDARTVQALFQEFAGRDPSAYYQQGRKYFSEEREQTLEYQKTLFRHV